MLCWMLDGDEKRIKVDGTWRAAETAIVVDWSPTNTGKVVDWSPTNLQSTDGWTEAISLDKMNQHGGRGGWYSIPNWCGA